MEVTLVRKGDSTKVGHWIQIETMKDEELFGVTTQRKVQAFIGVKDNTPFEIGMTMEMSKTQFNTITWS